MNAMMREPYEVPVVANETIEVSLASLRTGLDEVKADVHELQADYRSLRDKADQNYDTLSRSRFIRNSARPISASPSSLARKKQYSGSSAAQRHWQHWSKQ